MLLYREDHLLFVRRTEARYAASETLTCRPRAVISFAHNTVPQWILALIWSTNKFLNQISGVITIYKITVINALKESHLVTRRYFQNCFLRSVYDREVYPQLAFSMRPVFPYAEKCILTTGNSRRSCSWWFFSPEDGVGLVPKRGCLLTSACYAFPRW
jgi:hypothetical protein